MDISISPTLMLGVVLFIILILVARAWLLQDERDRRDAGDRRQLDDNPAFPFYDDGGQWVTRERRKRPERRQIHTFISREDFRQPK